MHCGACRSGSQRLPGCAGVQCVDRVKLRREFVLYFFFVMVGGFFVNRKN